MHNPRAFRLAHLIPQNNAVRVFGVRRHIFDQVAQFRIAANLIFGRQLVEGTVIRPSFHLFALEFAQHMIFALQHVRRAFGQIIGLVTLLHRHIGQCGTDRRRNVARQRPRRRRPRQKRFVGTSAQRELYRDTLMRQIRIPIRHNFMLADCRRAARAPCMTSAP